MRTICKLGFVAVVATFSFSRVIDFNELGKTYSIEEENGNDVIAKNIKTIDFKSIEKKLKKDYDKEFTSSVNYRKSNLHESNIKIDKVKARWDIIDPNGNVLAKKGDFIESSLPGGVSLSLCFIDGKYKKEILEDIVKSFGKCEYIVDNYDSRLFQKEFNVIAFPFNASSIDVAKRFNVKKLPTKIYKKKNTLETTTLNMNILIEKYKGI